MPVSVSDTTRQSVYAQETDEVFIVLVTIEHPDLSSPIRVCSNSEDLTSRGNLYLAYPFTLQLPDSNPTSPPRAKIQIDNISRDIINTLRTITTSPTITFEIIRAAAPDTVEVSMPNYTLNNVQYDALVITGDLGVEQYLLEPYPSTVFSPNFFPGLF